MDTLSSSSPWPRLEIDRFLPRAFPLVWEKYLDQSHLYHHLHLPWIASLLDSSLLARSILTVSLMAAGVTTWAVCVSRMKSKRDAAKPRFRRLIQLVSTSAEATDSPLLRKHSEFHAFQTSIALYPSIRVFYRPHPQGEKIPNDPEPLPLLVFIHGLGGSLAQFNSILSSLVNVAPCLGIDLPGCGRSKFAPKDWKAYDTEALVALLDTVIEKYRTAQDGQQDRGVVLISHSMGCSLSTLLAAHDSPYPAVIRQHIKGLVAICPKAEPASPEQVKVFRRLLWIPTPLFNLFRMWDRRGGTESASVRRFVGPEAGIDTRKLQLRFNAQSKTPVWRRMAWGALPTYDEAGHANGGLPGPEVWKSITYPLYLIAGEADAVTKPEEVQVILDAINNKPPRPHHIQDDIVPDSSKIMDTEKTPTGSLLNNDEGFGLTPSTTVVTNNDAHPPVVRSTILPSPASHGMIYDHGTYRTVAGLIADFLTETIDPRLSLGWQLQHLTTSGKWDVKNLTKWQAVAPVSAPIGPPGQPIFRALKTLRKQDPKHTPTEFVKEWRGKIFAIIDISHDSPTYDPAELEAGGIQYHKFPTVSKIPPTVQEVQDFIALVDRLHEEMHAAEEAKTISSTDSTDEKNTENSDLTISSTISSSSATLTVDSSKLPPHVSQVIGVHCHYGYNRTGFFIVCYLVEKLGYRLEDAIEEFRRQRAPGIRHEHFIDTLYVRYTIGSTKSQRT